jgi:cytosine/adenosine deaminase-related metal-dependent hydrolase
VLIGIVDELRQLEYSQRIFHRARNVLAEPGQSNGRNLFTAAVFGGNQALGRAKSGLAAGVPADFVSLDPSHPTLAGKAGDAILDAWIFAGGARVDCVWVRGEKRVEGGRHFRREAIAQKFRTVMMELVYT